MWFRRGIRAGCNTCCPICLSDMEQPDLAMTPHDHGWVLLGEYLPHLRDGVPQCAASFQTGGALAHGYSGGIAAHRSQACSPRQPDRLWRKGVTGLRQGKKEVEQNDIRDKMRPVYCPKCGWKLLDAVKGTKTQTKIPHKGRVSRFIYEVRALRARRLGSSKLNSYHRMFRAGFRDLPDSCGNTTALIRNVYDGRATDSEAGKTGAAFV